MIATPKKESTTNNSDPLVIDHIPSTREVVLKSWEKIPPFWPLKNLVAVNPVAGFENLNFEEALKKANAYFQQQEMPSGMQEVNRESIKWLQVFFDQGQSTIKMPLRNLGFLKSTLTLIRFDKNVHKNDPRKIQWLKDLPPSPEALITKALLHLDIKTSSQETFLTLMLTTLPGWASYIQYRSNWADAKDKADPNTITLSEYLAFRLVLTCLIWPKSKELLVWHKNALENSDTNNTYAAIIKSESSYQQSLIKNLEAILPPPEKIRPQAQLVFCIDVRSEPFRRAIEAQGNYDTYGFAGFFGIPVAIENPITGDSYASCPVLLKPAYTVGEFPNNCTVESCKEGQQKIEGFKRLYQSVKYTFAPFSLVETIGLASGLWMGLRSLTPKGASFIQSALKKWLAPAYAVTPDTSSIPLQQQVEFGASALKLMGLTENFAPIVVFCGHGSTTENNAYASSLDCGACGGRHGAPNARILAKILNNEIVRSELKNRAIYIPDDTTFLAAEHNTTTDEVTVYDEQTPEKFSEKIRVLKNDLELARIQNCLWRATELGIPAKSGRVKELIALRAIDWAQVRPEWGLAGNAAFITGPRWLSKNCNLEGRSFLHSYEWEKDIDGSCLKTILTAPMVVAQWINSQYLFSTLDNVAFGSGSKITKNVTGKIGVMQGNASDLMHGLPLQSVYKSDEQLYHKPQRLTVVVYAPKNKIDRIVEEQEILQKLFGNGWVHLICLDPQDNKKHILKPDLKWANYN